MAALAWLCATAFMIGSMGAARSADSMQPGTCSGAKANPWVYNFEVDGYPAKVLNDGQGLFPVEAGPFLEPPLIARALRKRFLNDTMYTLDNNVLYIDHKDGGILFDAGSGPNDESEGGLGAIAKGLGQGVLFDLLDAEGISRKSIKSVILTHGHFDRLGGLVEGLQSLTPAFPEATVYISKAEFDYWTAEEVDFGQSQFPPEFQIALSAVAKGVLGAAKPQLKTFEFDEEVIPGVTAIATPYHTPGSVAFLIKDGSSSLLFSGDSFTHKVLSIEDPRFPLRADIDQVGAPFGRYALLDQVVEGKWKVLASRTPLPSVLGVDHLGLVFQTTVAEYMGSPEVMTICI